MKCKFDFPRLLLFLALVSPEFTTALQAQDVVAGGAVNPPPHRQKVRIHDPELAHQLSRQGAELIADYGSFQLFRLDDTLARTAFSLPGAETADHQNIIALNARHLDTTTAEIKALRKSVLPSKGKRLHLVQFAGPIKPEWRHALEATGVHIVTYIPHNAYLVYGQGPALGQMQAWAATADC